MFVLSIFISTLLVGALSRPQEPVAAAGKAASPPIAIVSQNEEINPDGSFKFSYETANGIKVEESGYLKDGADATSTDKIQVIEGSVSYTDNDGQVISLKYIADENGFQPQGDHLPTAPSLPSAGAEARALPQKPAASAPVQKAVAAPAPAPPAPAAPAPAVPEPPATSPAAAAQPEAPTTALP